MRSGNGLLGVLTLAALGIVIGAGLYIYFAQRQCFGAALWLAVPAVALIVIGVAAGRSSR